MLTDRTCKAAKSQEKAYKLTDSGSLYLEVMPNGSKYWRYRYLFRESAKVKDKRIALGVYPEVSLLEARELRDKAKRLLRDGIDPANAKKDEKVRKILDTLNTFEAIAREWHTHYKERWSEAHGRVILRRIELDILPLLGTCPIKDITTQSFIQTIRHVEERGAHEIARRLVQICNHIFRYAAITGRIESNPADNIKGILKPYKKGHYAAFEAKDLPNFLSKLHRNEARLFAPTRLAVEMILLTFVRTGELIKAKWSEFDLNERMWTIPAVRMKMRKDHLVPLSDRVLEILRELKAYSPDSDYLFAGMHDPKHHISNNTILMALRRMGYQGIMTGHGFRALAMSTIKEKLHYRHEVIDRQLAHSHKSDVDKAYDRAMFLDERIKMMQDWADYVGRIV